MAALIVLLGQVLYLLVWPGRADLYRLFCTLVVLVVLGAVALWRLLSNPAPEGAGLSGFGGLAFASGLLRGLIWSAVVFALVAVVSWGFAKTPIYPLFYDRGFDQLHHDLVVLTEAKSYQPAIDRIDQRLGRLFDKPLSPKNQKVLAQMKVDSLIALGHQASRWEDKVYYFSGAEETARRWKLDPSLADAELRAARPTPTPLPTSTPGPTSTPQPTWTPQPPLPTYTPPPVPPTYIPYPTPLPTATPPPVPVFPTVEGGPPLDFSKCHEVVVDERLGAPGEFHAWDCSEWGWYGQWQPGSGDNPIGGHLPQIYVSSVCGRFYLCPPKGGESGPYTATNCD